MLNLLTIFKTLSSIDDKLRSIFYSFVVLNKTVETYKGRVFVSYESNWFYYLYSLSRCVWLFFLLIFIYKDIISLILLVSVFFLMFLFCYGKLPNFVLANLVGIFIIVNDNKFSVYYKIFGYGIVLILFLSSHVGISALYYLRLLFSVYVVGELISHFFGMHMDVQLRIFDKGVIKDLEVLEILHPLDYTMTLSEINNLLETGVLSKEEGVLIKIKKKDIYEDNPS